jgi:hypothetical protein
MASNMLTDCARYGRQGRQGRHRGVVMVVIAVVIAQTPIKWALLTPLTTMTTKKKNYERHKCQKVLNQKMGRQPSWSSA